jgi:inhibitor of KinA sporulation pathway (predicted exonuclease)
MNVPSIDPALGIKQFEYLLVVDIEATCWESNEGRVHEMETLEFAAAVVRTSDLSVIEAFSIIIQPRVHPQLSDYCKSLTHISQAQANAGIRFEEIADVLAPRLQPYLRSIAWASWGNYDRRQLEQDASRWGVPAPLGEITHINLKKAFAKKRRIKGTRPSVRRALDIVELPYEGVAHSGIDDVRNITRLLAYL